MNSGKGKISIAVFLFLLITTILQPVSWAEAEGIQLMPLTLEECIEKALDYTHQVEIIDKAIEDLREQHYELKKASVAIQEQLDALDRITRLYDKEERNKEMTLEERMELQVYKQIYGIKPPSFTKEEEFHNFIKTRDFYHYSVWAGIENTKIRRELAIQTISFGIKQIYDGILDLQDALFLQQELYNNMEEQNRQMIVRYEKGLVSELEKYLSDSALRKQSINIEKLKRTIDNLEMSLKQQTGISLHQKIEIKSYDEGRVIRYPLAYEEYISKALQNRSEIVIARMDLHVKQRELDIMKEYITSELLTERLEAQQAADEQAIALDEAIDAVTKDINAGYMDIEAKRKDMYITFMNKQKALRNYDNANEQYNQGMIGLSILWNVRMALTQAEISYGKAIRDYNNAVYKLDLACGIGPGFSSVLGGM